MIPLDEHKLHPAALNMKIYYNASWTMWLNGLSFHRSLRSSWKALRPSDCCATVRSNRAGMMGRTWIASWPKDRFRYVCLYDVSLYKRALNHLNRTVCPHQLSWQLTAQILLFSFETLLNTMFWFRILSNFLSQYFFVIVHFSRAATKKLKILISQLCVWLIFIELHFHYCEVTDTVSLCVNPSR